MMKLTIENKLNIILNNLIDTKMILLKKHKRLLLQVLKPSVSSLMKLSLVITLVSF